MLASFLLLAAMAPQLGECVSARWDSADPATLRLLEKTPVSCLLLEPGEWDAAFLKAAKGAGLRVLAVVRSAEQVSRAAVMEFDALVAEGAAVEAAGKPVVRLTPRAALDLDHPAEVMGTTQGLWPGIRVEKDGAAVSLPTGAPWIETNSGFLRVVRTILPPATGFWMAMRPPEGQALGARNYVTALADASMNGTSWVLALDRGFAKGLFAGDERYVAEWRKIVGGWAFLEGNREYGRWRDQSSLSLIQDADSGALFSGGFVDMLTARHIPMQITPAERVAKTTKESTEVLLNVGKLAADSPERQLLLGLARQGITVFNSPLDWNPGRPKGDVFTIAEEDVKGLADAWREINTMLGRRNFGLRVFGAPSMLSNLKISPDGKKRAVHLLNYSDYPVEHISLHLTGVFKSARVLTPQGERKAEIYPIEGGTEVEVDKVDDLAVVVIE
jgi:hypothetical protein